MQIWRIITTIAISLIVQNLSAFQVNNFERSAVSVNKFTLFPDSSFYDHSNIAITEGRTFEILEESKLYHEDDSQTQKYKWYKVKLDIGKVGWVFGNNIAVYEKQNEAIDIFSGVEKANLSRNYKDAKIWIAELQGFDSNTASKLPYKEKYVVFTNSYNQSRYIQIGREQVEGKSWSQDVRVVDLNGDSYDEVIVQLNSKSSMSHTTNQYIEIFSMKHDALKSIYSEKINLGKSSKNIAPVNKKFFEVEDGSIRVAYIDYFDCARTYGGTCMEYVTYSYFWDKASNSFETLYETSRTSPVIKPKYDNLNLFPGPGLNQSVGIVGTRETLKVLGQEKKHYKLGNDALTKIYFHVETFDGKKGYIESKNVEFIENDFSKALNSYYSSPTINHNSYDQTIMAVKVAANKM